MGALIRKGALIGRRALNRIITVHKYYILHNEFQNHHSVVRHSPILRDLVHMTHFRYSYLSTINKANKFPVSQITIIPLSLIVLFCFYSIQYTAFLFLPEWSLNKLPKRKMRYHFNISVCVKTLLNILLLTHYLTYLKTALAPTLDPNTRQNGFLCNANRNSTTALSFNATSRIL